MTENQEQTETKGDTLLTLLTRLEQADEGLLEVKPEEHKELLLNAELKVDAYKYILNRYDSRITEIQNEIDELTAVKRSLQNKSDGLKRLLLWVLKERKIESFPGLKYSVKLMSRKKISLISEPTSAEYLNHPTLVKRTYLWDKKAFDKAFKENPETFKQYGIEDKSEFVKFDLRKGIE